MANPFDQFDAHAAPRGVVMRDPYKAADEDRKKEDARREAERLDLDRRKADIDALLADLKVQETRNTLTEKGQAAATDDQKRERKSISDRMKYGNVLSAVRAAREIAKRGGTGWSGLLSGLPESDAKALKVALSPIIGNLSFDRLQEMRSDPDNQTGGAVGSVTENELALLGSTVASLDTTVSRDQFLANLDRIERHFVGSQLALAGVDPYSDEGTQLFQQFGVTLPEQKVSQAGLGETTQSGKPIPPEMQRENEALISAFLETRDPDSYAIARAELDEKYGFEPDIAYHRNWAEKVALPALREGKTIGGAVPPPEVPLEGFDWLANAATAEPTGIGAFAASMGNAGGFGIPTLLAGRDRMEALRGQSPTASLLGEMAGAVTGSMGAGALGGVASKALGGSGKVAELLANPVATDAAYGAAYGATQADDPLYGAVAGGAGGYIGSKIGGAVARELPGLVGAGGAVRAADEAVPTIPALKEQADQLYTAARGSGGVVDPAATTSLQQNARTMMANEGRVLPDGSLMLDSLPKVKEALDILDAYAGQPMTAPQTDAARKVLSGAAGSMDGNEARIARALLGDFDQTVDPFVPGFGEARGVASRYLNAENIDEAIRLADPRAAQYSQSGLDNALRTEFRKLDRNAIQGRGRYGDLVTKAIEDVSRGTPVSNAARWFGKFAPRGVVSTGASAGPAFYIGNSVGGPAGGAALAGGVMAAGETGKRVAEKLTQRQANVAELLARGGEDYALELEKALTTAQVRGGHAGVGLFDPVVLSLYESTQGN